MLLRFGHPEDKDALRHAAAVARVKARIVANVFDYYTRYVRAQDWPTESAPLVFYPPSFRRVPLSTLQEAARRLQAEKRRIAEGGQDAR